MFLSQVYRISPNYYREETRTYDNLYYNMAFPRYRNIWNHLSDADQVRLLGINSKDTIDFLETMLPNINNITLCNAKTYMAQLAGELHLIVWYYINRLALCLEATHPASSSNTVTVSNQQLVELEREGVNNRQLAAQLTQTNQDFQNCLRQARMREEKIVELRRRERGRSPPQIFFP